MLDKLAAAVGNRKVRERVEGCLAGKCSLKGKAGVQETKDRLLRLNPGREREKEEGTAV